MKYIKIVSLCLIMSFLVGCATRGRISLIDLDLRTPEQIEAYSEEAGVVYKDKNEQTTDETDIKSVSSWNIFKNIIEVIDGRVRILYFEWDKNKD